MTWHYKPQGLGPTPGYPVRVAHEVPYKCHEAEPDKGSGWSVDLISCSRKGNDKPPTAASKVGQESVQNKALLQLSPLM